MIAHYHDKTLGEVRELDIPAMVQDIGHLLYGQPVCVPAQFAFTGRAIGTLAGVSTGLAPELNFVEVAIPYARKFLGFDAEGAEQTLYSLFNQVLDTGRALLTLPRSLEQIVTRLEAGPLEIKLVSDRPGGWKRFRGPGNDGNFALPFMFAVSLAGGIFLLTDIHQLIAGWFCLGLAGLTALRVVKG